VQAETGRVLPRFERWKWRKDVSGNVEIVSMALGLSTFAEAVFEEAWFLFRNFGK